MDLLILESLASNDVLLALGRVEVDRQLDSLGLIDSEWEVRLFLQVLQSESLQILFCQRLCVEHTGCWSFVVGFAWGSGSAVLRPLVSTVPMSEGK